MCLASEKYDEGDYIRDYDEFLKYKNLQFKGYRLEVKGTGK